jgi:hypothetical protein
MTDGEFKLLSHKCDRFSGHSVGRSIGIKYNPDVSLRCDNEYILIEHESEPNRKTVIADIAKAAFFLQNDKHGILVIVLTPKGESSFESYPNYCREFFNWIKGKSNLREVKFIHQEDYCGKSGTLEIGSNEFNANCITLK